MFVVLSATSIPDHLRGYLRRFLIEFDTNVFVGKTSARVADLLWTRCVAMEPSGTMVFVRSNPTVEQGFTIERYGNDDMGMVEIDGLTLALRPASESFMSERG